MFSRKPRGCDNLIPVVVTFVYFASSFLRISNYDAPVQMACVVGAVYTIRVNDRVYGDMQIFVDHFIDASKSYKGPCRFINKNAGYEDIVKNNDSRTFFLTFHPDAFCKMIRSVNRQRKDRAKNTLFGPGPVPHNWAHFPGSDCIERNWTETLNLIGSWVVPSEKVRNHMARRTRTTDRLHKYAVVRPCTNFYHKKIPTYEERKFDVLIIEEYNDIDKSRDGEILYEELTNLGYAVVKMRVRGEGDYMKLEKRALASKTVVNFKFYDHMGIHLKMVQSYGLYAFTLDETLIGHKNIAMYVPELETSIRTAARRISGVLEKFAHNPPNALTIAALHENAFRCSKSINDVCNFVINMDRFTHV